MYIVLGVFIDAPEDEFGWLIELSCSISGNGIVQYSSFCCLTV